MPCPPDCDHDHTIPGRDRDEIGRILDRTIGCVLSGCHTTSVPEVKGIGAVTGEVTISAVQVARKVREHLDSGRAHTALWGRPYYIGPGMDDGNENATKLIMRTLHDAGVFNG